MRINRILYRYYSPVEWDLPKTPLTCISLTRTLRSNYGTLACTVLSSQQAHTINDLQLRHVQHMTTPTLKKRLCSMLYESMLLFGLLFVSTWAFSTLFDQRHALYLRHALEIWLFVVMGGYFVWFWCRSGQTLAMQTWRIRVVTTSGAPLTRKRAFARYLLCWLWFLPGMALSYALQLQGAMLVLLPTFNIIAWAATIYLDADRQFLHDRIAGTRLVNVTTSKNT